MVIRKENQSFGVNESVRSVTTPRQASATQTKPRAIAPQSLHRRCRNNQLKLWQPVPAMMLNRSNAGGGAWEIRPTEKWSTTNDCAEAERETKFQIHGSKGGDSCDSCDDLVGVIEK